LTSMEKTQLHRFNAKWRDPKSEDINYLHLPDAAWQRETNYLHPWDAFYPPSPQSRTSRAQRLPSSHPIGHTSRGSKSSTTWPPIPSTTPPHTTFSSPDGKARGRGSDDHGRAWWPFDCHVNMATHTPRRNTHFADDKPKYFGPTPLRLQPTGTTTTTPLPAPRTRRSSTVDS
jgi:hypothetical protein